METFITLLIPIVLGVWIGIILSSRKQKKTFRQHVKIVDVDTFRKNMRKGQLIDIRKSEKFDEGRIKGARNFSIRMLKNKAQKQVRKDQPLYIYCENGKKSFRHATALIKKGYPAVYVLSGGYKAYAKREK